MQPLRARAGVLAAPLCMFFAVLSFEAHASADDVTADVCIHANEQAGPLRRAGKLRDARASLRLCSVESCPIAVRKDCLDGFAQVDGDVPRIAFSAQDPDGNDLSAVKVSIDGEPLADHIDGKAVDVDPGEHVFRFEAPGQPAVEKRLVIVEGDKKRFERIDIGERRSAPLAVSPLPPQVSAAPRTEMRRTVGFVTGATGLGLLAVGGAAAIAATLEWSAARHDCGSGYPATCADLGDASSARSATIAAGTVADLALVIGGAAVVTGAALVLLTPPPGQPGAPVGRLTLAPSLGPATTGVVLHGTF